MGPHRTHDLRSGSQNHHPSTKSVQKTICCNSTSNAPDDGRMRPKHVELRFLFGGAAAQRGPWPPHSWGFYITQRRITFGRTPLDAWSARRRDLYLTTHNTHNRQTSMPPVGFEPTISAGERPQTYALDRVATETGRTKNTPIKLPRCIKLAFHIISWDSLNLRPIPVYCLILS